MTGINRRIVGFVLLVVTLPIAFLSFLAGHMVAGGIDNADIQCAYITNQLAVPLDVQTEGGPDAAGEWSVFPLGIACVFDEPGDGIPSQTVVHPNWTATIVWVGSSIALIGGLTMVIWGWKRELATR
jgi:hypothetical protein